MRQQGNDKTYSVYRHTFPNGMVYVGVTSLSPNQRFRKGNGYKYQPLVYTAILEYGWDNIEHEILFTGLTKEEAKQKEADLIAKHKSNQNGYGYNLDSSGLDNKHSEQTKRKIRDANKGKIRSAETRKRISIAKKGYKHTEEWKRQVSKKLKGRKLSEQARINISNSKKGSKNPNYGKKTSQESINKRLQSEYYKKVAQYTIDGILIRVFERISVASAETGVCPTNISRVCNGKRVTAGGFKWEFLEKEQGIYGDEWDEQKLVYKKFLT